MAGEGELSLVIGLVIRASLVGRIKKPAAP